VSGVSLKDSENSECCPSAWGLLQTKKHVKTSREKGTWEEAKRAQVQASRPSLPGEPKDSDECSQ
jgi:hypothetical protein